MADNPLTAMGGRSQANRFGEVQRRVVDTQGRTISAEQLADNMQAGVAQSMAMMAEVQKRMAEVQYGHQAGIDNYDPQMLNALACQCVAQATQRSTSAQRTLDTYHNLTLLGSGGVGVDLMTSLRLAFAAAPASDLIFWNNDDASQRKRVQGLYLDFVRVQASLVVSNVVSGTSIDGWTQNALRFILSQMTLILADTSDTEDPRVNKTSLTYFDRQQAGPEQFIWVGHIPWTDQFANASFQMETPKVSPELPLPGIIAASDSWLATLNIQIQGQWSGKGRTIATRASQY